MFMDFAATPDLEDQLRRAELLALEQPELDTTQEPAYQPRSRFQGFLEHLAGLESQVPSSAGLGFGAGLVGGLARSLGTAGTKAATQRKTFEESAAKRQAQRDAANRAATARANEAKAARLRGDVAASRTEAAKKAEYERDTVVPTPEQLKAAPWLARVVDSKGRVPQSILATAFKPEKEPKPEKERLVAIETPEGPRYVRESDALGKPPQKTLSPSEKPKPPTQGERTQLADDIGMLKQIGAVRESFVNTGQTQVGPVRGPLAALGNRVGLAPPGTAKFKSSLAGIRNVILRLRSGGAVTPSEADRLLQELPTENDPTENFLAKLNNFERAYRDIAQTRRDVMTGSNVDISKIPALPRPSPDLLWVAE